jgi:hypothetical protein
MTWAQTALVAIPVPLALAAGLLVPSGEDRLLLWVVGVASMFAMYSRWALRGWTLPGTAESGPQG